MTLAKKRPRVPVRVARQSAPTTKKREYALTIAGLEGAQGEKADCKRQKSSARIQSLQNSVDIDTLMGTPGRTQELQNLISKKAPKKAAPKVQKAVKRVVGRPRTKHAELEIELESSDAGDASDDSEDGDF
jgi:hypothetical protein